MYWWKAGRALGKEIQLVSQVSDPAMRVAGGGIVTLHNWEREKEQRCEKDFYSEVYGISVCLPQSNISIVSWFHYLSKKTKSKE